MTISIVVSFIVAICFSIILTFVFVFGLLIVQPVSMLIVIVIVEFSFFPTLTIFFSLTFIFSSSPLLTFSFYLLALSFSSFPQQLVFICLLLRFFITRKICLFCFNITLRSCTVFCVEFMG